MATSLSKPSKPQPSEDFANMTLVEHLRELRKRLTYSLVAIFAGFIIVYSNAAMVFGWLVAPLLRALPEGQEKRLVFTGLAQPFMVDVKVGIFGGLILALPFLLYQIWLFVGPALYHNERRGVFPFVVSALGCFAVGAGFAYFIAFPFAFAYFLGYTTEHVQPMISIHEYLDFVTKMLLGFGLMFELPLVIFILAKLGLVGPTGLARNRQWAVLAIAVVSAIFTPADIISMIVMAVPLYILYEFSILLARMVYKDRPSLVDEDGNFVATDKA
jgi:sec-independent protein translocase protein TatC